MRLRLRLAGVRPAPPGQEGRAPVRKFREASLATQTGWSANHNRIRVELDRPPRLARYCGFATFLDVLGPPRLARRGMSFTLRRFPNLTSRAGALPIDLCLS